MLNLLNVYTVAHSFTDHPLYDGERYRSGGAVTVERGTKVRPLYVLKQSDHAPDTLYMAQTVKEDGSAGVKIRLYEGDVTVSTIENSTVPSPASGAWSVNPFNHRPDNFFFDETCQTVVPEYVNTVDSILREEVDDSHIWP